MKKLKSFKALFILPLICLLMFTCSTNPVTGKKELMLLSEQGELALGKESDPGIVASYGRYNDDNIQAFINDKGKQMAAISHRSNLNYEFKVLDSPVVNAFAVPGGYVYFTRGILAHFNNEAEFAGVLGHEIGHITARHSAKQYSKSMAAQVGLGLGMVFSKDFRQFANTAQTGLALLFLKFGRDAESQSDRLGVEYSTKIGYDAHEMANFFKTIGRLRDQSGQSIPTFMSTHPDPGDRYNKVHQDAAKWQKDFTTPLKINREEYLNMIEGLVYGADPRQGYFENNYFYHPELKFQFPVPNGWQTQNTPGAVVMQSTDQKAAIQLTLGQGASASAAEQKFISSIDSVRVMDSRAIRVNGLPAQMNLFEVQGTRVLAYFIEYNGIVYQLLGMAKSIDYRTYESFFRRTLDGFSILRDPSKMNVSPERIRVKTIARNSTLEEALRSYNMESSRHAELAILNGMELNDQVLANTKIKVIGK